MFDSMSDKQLWNDTFDAVYDYCQAHPTSRVRGDKVRFLVDELVRVSQHDQESPFDWQRSTVSKRTVKKWCSRVGILLPAQAKYVR